MTMKRVVITGMGVISPLGNDVHTFWKHLTEGKSGISFIDSFDVSGSKTKIAGTVRDFDAEERWGRKEARRLDRFSQFALAALNRRLKAPGFSSIRLTVNASACTSARESAASRL